MARTTRPMVEKTADEDQVSPVPVPQVREQLACHENLVGRLHAAISALESRLSDITRPATDTPADLPEERALVLLAEDLRKFNQGIEDAIVALTDLLERIEL